MRKGFIEYILIVVILMILVVATVFVLNSNSPTPTPTLPPDAFSAPTIESTEPNITQPAANGYESTGSITMPSTEPTTFDINNLDSNASSIDSNLSKLSTDVTAINAGLNDQMGDLSE